MYKTLKAVIFDMDGVIFDSERLVLECWKDISSKYHLEGVAEVFMKCIGTNSQKTREIFQEHYGKDFPYVEFRRNSANLFMDKCNGGELPIKKGVGELLEYLTEHKYVIGLASSTRYEIVKRELEKADLLKYFHNITCGDMVSKSKPEPDIYLKACQEIKIDPKEVIAIEDSYNGIRAAHSAGMIPFMVPDLVLPDDEMKTLAYKIFSNLCELKEWLENAC